MTNTVISIIKPEGYIHSDCFLEVAETLKYALEELGYTSEVRYNHIDKDSINIILGWHLLGYLQDLLEDPQLPSTTIIYNLEQMGGNAWMRDNLRKLSKFEIWDYSPRNIECLDLDGVKLVPIGYMPQMTRIESGPYFPVDVLFYGSINQRRERVLDELCTRGLRLKQLFGIYGKERDYWIGKSKVVLNMHYYESKVFESVRVSYLMANRKCVVSEGHPGTNPGIIETDYDDLANTCVTVCNSDWMRIGKEEEALKEIQKHSMIDHLRNAGSRILEIG